MPTPFEHQKEMLRFHSQSPHTLDNSEVGTGKTAPMVVYLQELFKLGQVDSALVVCPNTIIDNWGKEITTWSKLAYIALRGTKEGRLKLLRGPADIFLINFEGVRVIHSELMAKK